MAVIFQTLGVEGKEPNPLTPPSLSPLSLTLSLTPYPHLYERLQECIRPGRHPPLADADVPHSRHGRQRQCRVTRRGSSADEVRQCCHLQLTPAAA